METRATSSQIEKKIASIFTRGGTKKEGPLEVNEGALYFRLGGFSPDYELVTSTLTAMQDAGRLRYQGTTVTYYPEA